MKIFLFLIGAIVVFAIAMLSKKAAVTAAFLMIGFGMFIRIRYKVEGNEQKLSNLDSKMSAMEEEHRKLELEKEELLIKIKEFGVDEVE